MLPTMQGLMKNVMYVSQGKIPMSAEGMLFISGSIPGAWAYLMVWSTSRSLSLTVVKIIYKDINPKGLQ